MRSPSRVVLILFAVFSFLVAVPLLKSRSASTPTYDLILRHGTIYDGTGHPPITADVAITADKIAAVGDLKSATAKSEIDVTGLAVAPGFVNMLSWATDTLI